MPVGGGLGEELYFEFLLPQAERSLIGFEILQGVSPDVGRDPAFGASPCIEVNRIVGHRYCLPGIIVRPTLRPLHGQGQPLRLTFLLPLPSGIRRDRCRS